MHNVNKELNENDLSKIQTFSHSLGTLFWQIGVYSIIQIIAAVILMIISAGMIFSIIGETSLSVIFSIFQAAIWTILITSIILEVVLYFFLFRLIRLLKGAEKQGIPYQDKYRKSALFFIAGIILGVILFVVAIFLTTWILELIWGIFNDPLFNVEDLEQIPSTDIISTLVGVGRIVLSLAGFYYLQRNFEQLDVYMQNGDKIVRGLRLLISGYLLLILGDLIGLVVDLGSLLGLVGLILTIVGYFKASDGLKNTIWKL